MGLILVEMKTKRREIARGTDRNDLALVAQCEFLNRNVIYRLVNDGCCEIDDHTILVIEEEPTDAETEQQPSPLLAGPHSDAGEPPGA